MRALWVPKMGSDESEWEDGFAYDESQGRAAITDGASSAVAAASWARLLASGFVHDPFMPGHAAEFGDWLLRRQGEWEPPPAAASDDWWNDAVLERGSWATLAVLAIAESHDIDEGRAGWIAHIGVVGDTAIAHVRDGARLNVAPALSADDFTTHPELVGTEGKSIERTCAAYETHSFAADDGDVLLGLTDALAEWALSQEQLQDDVWETLASVDQTSLVELVDDERAAGRMVNDDVTLLRCQLGMR